MDILDKIIVERGHEFEEEPNEGHFDRFGEKLRMQKTKSKAPKISAFLKIAAVLIIILLSANLVIYFTNPKSDPKGGIAIKSDLNEASFYYTSKISTGIHDLEKMAGEGIGSPKEIVQIKHELSEMDSLFVNLQQEYRANPNDERIINAMIEYYQTKLDIVNTIKTDLENVKNLKSKKHENHEI